MMRNTNSQRSNTDDTFIDEMTGKAGHPVLTVPVQSRLMPPKDPPNRRPRLPYDFRQYSSKLDQLRGSLRTATDGNLLNGDTGDWLLLNTPPHHTETRLQSNRKSPAISLPEAQNGARTSFSRLLRNKVFSSSHSTSTVKTNLEMLAKTKLHTEIRQSREKGDAKVDMQVLEEVSKYYGLQIGQRLSGDWFEHVLVDGKFWLRVLEDATEMGSC
jgi:hypothetical protein